MAFESLQGDWRSARTLYRDQRYLIVDKPAGVACGPSDNESAELEDAAERSVLNAALPGEGAASAQSTSGGSGHVPLVATPARASGVTVLGVGGAAALVEGEAWPSPLLELGMIVGIDDCRLPAEGELTSREGAQVVSFHYRVTRRRAGRALVLVRGRVRPELVLRAFAAERQPLVGDGAAAGSPATRLLLHVQRVQLGPRELTAPLPIEFESWLNGAAERPPSRLAEALLEAAPARARLWPRYQAYRLLGEDSGEIAGLTVERYADHAVLSLSSDAAWSERERLADCLMDHGARGVYVKRRVRADLRGQDALLLAPPTPLRGSAAPDSITVRLGPLQFWVSLGNGLSTGLFLDQRINWDRVRRGARGVSLLNLFSYTGAFSVAAAAGGAASTVSVDLAGRALGRARQNLELNGLSGPEQHLLRSDVLGWLARARRTGRRFGWIVLDPPSFGTRARGVLRADRDYQSLVSDALGLLEPGGRLLCVSHQLGLGAAELSALVLGACQAGGHTASVEPWLGGFDAPSLPGVSATKSVLARLS